MIDLETAQRQADALFTCANDSPIAQYRDELHRRAKEWKYAIKTLEGDAEEEGVLEHAGCVTAGMWALSAGSWRLVVRQMMRDGQLTLQLEDEVGRPVYFTFVTPASPCVVRR